MHEKARLGLALQRLRGDRLLHGPGRGKPLSAAGNSITKFADKNTGDNP
jgi:hypothetical protein